MRRVIWNNAKFVTVILIHTYKQASKQATDRPSDQSVDLPTNQIAFRFLLCRTIWLFCTKQIFGIIKIILKCDRWVCWASERAWQSDRERVKNKKCRHRNCVILIWQFARGRWIAHTAHEFPFNNSAKFTNVRASCHTLSLSNVETRMWSEWKCAWTRVLVCQTEECVGLSVCE